MPVVLRDEIQSRLLTFKKEADGYAIRFQFELQRRFAIYLAASSPEILPNTKAMVSALPPWRALPSYTAYRFSGGIKSLYGSVIFSDYPSPRIRQNTAK